MKTLPALSQISPLNSEDVGVSEELIGRLCNANETVVFDLLKIFTAHERVDLAMYCFRRTHLREVGLQIAATCDLPIFEQAFGKILGHALYAQSRGRLEKSSTFPSHTRAKISLATSSEGCSDPTVDLDPDEAETETDTVRET